MEDKRTFTRSFTGRSRRRKTSASVKLVDRGSRVLITIGGMGTILAVLTVCIFLVWVAVPLFMKDRISLAAAERAPWNDRQSARLIHLSVDEYQLIGFAMFDSGEIQVFRVDDGSALGEPRRPFGDRRLTAWSFSTDADDASFGFEDGSTQLARLGVRAGFLPEHAVPSEHRRLPRGSIVLYEGGILSHTETGQFRLHRFYQELEEPIKLSSNPVQLVGHTIRNSGPVIVALTGDGKLTINSVTIVRNFLTGAITPRVTVAELPYEPPPGAREPGYLMISGLGDTAYLAWRSGMLHRYDLRNLAAPTIAERVNLLTDPAARLTVLKFMIGRTTLIVGDSSGGLYAWFRIKPENAVTSDGTCLTRTHDLGAWPGVGVSDVTASARSRMMAAGFTDGSVRLFHVTTNKLLAADVIESTHPIAALTMSAKDDGIYAAAGDRFYAWHIERRYPAINLAAIVRPVWYEGYDRPMHMWQSSSGTDDFEPKYGLWPLVFGTLKATFYSMIFGLPIALAAAVFTSEFLHPRTKARIKPTIEMMASLPSVVLGFLAALVIAPFIESHVPATILSFFTIPLMFLFGAYLWQLLPQSLSLRLQRLRFGVIVALTPLGALLAMRLAPLVERLLFAGDIKRWLDGQIGAGLGGWIILLLPLSAVTVALAMSLYVNPRIRRHAGDWTRGKLAAADLAKSVFALLATTALAASLGGLLTAIGWDPRGGQWHDMMGTYVQRNALIVGFIMGFAIIPIIYTIAEDALSAVPEHLRSASLGAGATPWQTAVRIIIPTAMSGLFSASMIGLGRAVGETMIVLMAAGNTPVMQMNIFNGFRTLSANIAVELPEAPINGTHYRMLFLAALSLFVMTFVVNTAAEIVRLRFRKKAFQL